MFINKNKIKLFLKLINPDKKKTILFTKTVEKKIKKTKKQTPIVLN